VLDGTRSIASISYVKGGRAANHLVTDEGEEIRLTHQSFMQMVNRSGFSLSTYNHPDRTEELAVKKGQGVKLPSNPKRKREYICNLIVEESKERPLILTVDEYSDGSVVLVGSKYPPKPKPAKEEAPAEE